MEIFSCVVHGLGGDKQVYDLKEPIIKILFNWGMIFGSKYVVSNDCSKYKDLKDLTINENEKSCKFFNI